MSPGANMSELEGSTKDVNRKPVKEVGEGSVECAKGGSEGVEGVEEEKKRDKKISEKEVPKGENVKKKVKKSLGVLADLKKVRLRNSAAAAILLDKKEEIFSPNEDFLADSFICYLCLVHEPVNSLVRHLDLTKHKANESATDARKNHLKVVICEGCRILLIGFRNMIRHHSDSNFHKNLSGNKPCFVEKEYELVVTGMNSVPRNIRKEIFLEVFEEVGLLKKMYMSPRQCVVYFEDSNSVREELGSGIIIDGYDVRLKWTEIKGPTFLFGTSVIDELTDIDKLYKKLDELIGDHDKIVNANEKKREAIVCESILNAVGWRVPGAVCHVFGSRLTGLSFAGSDLDVYLDCGGFYYGDMVRQEQALRQKLDIVAKCMRASREFTQIVVIRRASVPLVKIKHIETRIVCDISIKNGLAVENSALIKFIVGIDKRTKPMLLFVKYWMTENDLYGRPYFSSYAITLLVLYYLAQEPNPVLPTIQDLMSKREGPEKFIAGWNCGFLTSRSAIPKTKNTDTVPQLLLGFFVFFEKFDFNKNALSPLTGNHISREDFKSFRKTGLPHPYKNLTSVESFSSLWKESDKVCVMDPFDLSRNLTQHFPKATLKRFNYLCRLTAHLLSETMQHGNCDFLN